MLDLEPGFERTLAVAACIKQIGGNMAYEVVGSQLDMNNFTVSRVPVPPDMYVEMFTAFVGLDFARVMNKKPQWKQDVETGEMWEIFELDVEDEGGIL